MKKVSELLVRTKKIQMERKTKKVRAEPSLDAGFFFLVFSISRPVFDFQEFLLFTLYFSRSLAAF